MSPVTTTPTPLSARSVVLSLLLGAHPARLAASDLTRAGDHFGVAPATLRVALSRSVAAGDLVRIDGGYQLGERLTARQLRQDEAVEDAESAWDGAWEMAVVVVSGRTGAERAALRDELARARLAELREGVWTRPANLRRAPAYAGNPVLTTFRATTDEDPVALAARLWDLDAWSEAGRDHVRRLDEARDPADRLAEAALLVRHLSTDPLLPEALLPTGWPGGEMRATYAAYQQELRELALTGV